MTNQPKSNSRLTRREFLKLTGLAAGTGIAGAVAGMYARFFEPAWLQTTRLDIHIPGLGTAWEGLRILQLSDLHLDQDWMTVERAQQIVRAANALQADVITFTGDFVTPRSSIELLPLALSGLSAPMGVWAVLGNHDHWTDAAAVREQLVRCGIQELRNQVRIFERNGQSLALCGVDDAWERQADVKAVVSALTAAPPAILLAHEPDFADAYSQYSSFDLQLSGHSHGGQVRIPFAGAPILPPYGEKYPYGLYQVDGMWLYTNRGLGMAQPYVRINCPPEMTVIVLSGS